MNRSKTLTVSKYVLAFSAAFLLVFSSASHIHLRYCLDGDEPPVSVHFESKDSHTQIELAGEHSADKADFESELSLDTLLAKLSKLSADSVAILPTGFQPLTAIRTQALLHPEFVSIPRQPFNFLPPSRAPPELI